MNQHNLETRPASEDTRLIPLTQGQFAIVDAADYEWLIQWKWCANYGKRKDNNTLCYAVRWHDNGLMMMHRKILGLERSDRRQVDHINHNTLDNRRLNLRAATSSQNISNSRIGSRNTSGYKGVSFISKYGKWQATVRREGRNVNIGSFNSAEEAYAVYQEEVKRIYGEFAFVP